MTAAHRTNRGRPLAASALMSLLVIAAGAFLCAPSMAADDGTLKDIDARYQVERKACEKAPSTVDRTACLREAAAAREEARRGALNGAVPNYEKNAQARCEALPSEERDACIRRVRNEGVTKGSVTEGGVYREYKELDLPSATPGK